MNWALNHNHTAFASIGFESPPYPRAFACVGSIALPQRLSENGATVSIIDVDTHVSRSAKPGRFVARRSVPQLPSTHSGRIEIPAGHAGVASEWARDQASISFNIKHLADVVLTG
jgi:hypothetical protein